MSGGSQHNPNGRQSQLGPGWSPLQVASLLARAPQAHMASDRGVTWHTPTPPPHLYHVPAPSPPEPLQAMKTSGNSVFRHTATPPEIYRHTPTPPDKHLHRHTPSPGDVKSVAVPPPAELCCPPFPHLAAARDKVLRTEELLAYARGGVDLTVGSRGANGSPGPPAAPALSVRDAPTINSLIARAAPHPAPLAAPLAGPLAAPLGRAAHARVDALLERLGAGPAPSSPHSVIVHPRAALSPSPPSSNEDSADSCGAPPGSKRKRKPERTIRVGAPPPPAEVAPPSPPPAPLENGDAAHDIHNGPDKPPTPQPEPHTRRKTRSGSAETIDDIAAMIASTDRREPVPEPALPPEPETPVSVDKLKSVLASPEPETKSPHPEKSPKSPPPTSPSPQPEPAQTSPPKKDEPEPVQVAAAAPRRRSARTSNTESTNVPVESPSEAKPAEPEASEARSAEPAASSFVEVENQLEKMFAGLEEEAPTDKEPTSEGKQKKQTAKARKRRKSAPTKGERKASKRSKRSSTGDEATTQKVPKKKNSEKKKKDGSMKDAYDSGSNASSSRSRGPYIQIVGPRDSPVSVSVVNAAAGGAEESEWRGGGGGGGGGLRARGLHASTLGLRYDASTPDASWLCAFCERGPHHAGAGDLFGPYPLDTTHDAYRSLDEASRRRFASASGGAEAWFHEACGVWAPGVLAAGARVWGLTAAVCEARASRCHCGRAGAALACAARACRARAHAACAAAAGWLLPADYRALCPRHAAPAPAPAPAP